MRHRVAGALVFCVLFGASACSVNVARRQTATPTPIPTVMVGQQLEKQLDVTLGTPVPTQRHSDASFALRLSDDNDGHPSGVPVKVSGPVTRTVTSDADGYVKGNVPPGFYRFAVLEGCHGTVIVQKGGTGQAGVVEGATTGGTLLLLWQHRYGPAPPVFNDFSGDWPIGKAVDFTYAIEDHCKERPAAGKRISTFAFQTSKNIKLVKPPSLLAGKDGRSHVSVACTSAGDIRLDVYDKQNPKDSLDLMQLAIGYDRVPRCAAK
jgi:hypothetical protein